MNRRRDLDDYFAAYRDAAMLIDSAPNHLYVAIATYRRLQSRIEEAKKNEGASRTYRERARWMRERKRLYSRLIGLREGYKAFAGTDLRCFATDKG